MASRSTTATALVFTAALAFICLDGVRDGRAGLMMPEEYSVDTTSDSAALNACDPFLGPDCSLRGAIGRANTDNDASIITFHIDPGGIQTITVLAANGGLPAITQPVLVDGTSQLEGGEPCIPMHNTPCVRLTAQPGLAAGPGLTVGASNVTIRSLAIYGFLGDGLRVSTGAGNVTVAGNFLGTADGETAGQNNTGMTVAEGAGAVTIGGTTAADRNLIAGNGFGGLILAGSGTTVTGNYFGMDKDGAAVIGNGLGQASIETASGNTVGGTLAGAGNVINGSDGEGVLITGSNNIVQGNFIGTNPAGTAALADTNDEGVRVEGGTDNTIGGTTAAARNVISGNFLGVRVGNTTNLTIQGNFIGTNAGGTGPVPNLVGIFVFGDPQNLIIGGPEAGAGNVLSGNTDEAVALNRQMGTGALVQGNYIGLNAAGTAALPNRAGIALAPDSAPQVANNNEITNNVISGKRGERDTYRPRQRGEQQLHQRQHHRAEPCRDERDPQRRSRDPPDE